MMSHTQYISPYTIIIYCRNCHRMAGWGAPIHDPEGRLLVVLVIFGPYEKANRHTPGMVVAAEQTICSMKAKCS
jgi:hypothetical protein